MKRTSFSAIAPKTIASLLILSLAGWAFIHALLAGFVADDWHFLQQSPNIDVSTILFSPWAINTFYRPLTQLSLYIDATVFGGVDVVLHLESLLIHGLNALLLTIALRRLHFGEGEFTRGVALLFFFSPLNGEVVSFWSARGPLIATTFALLCIVTAKPTQSGWRVAPPGFFLLSLLSYEGSFLFSIACYLAAVRVQSPTFSKAVRHAILSLAVLLAVYAALRIYATGIGSTYGSGLLGGDSVVNALRALVLGLLRSLRILVSFHVSTLVAFAIVIFGSILRKAPRGRVGASFLIGILCLLPFHLDTTDTAPRFLYQAQILILWLPLFLTLQLLRSGPRNIVLIAVLLLSAYETRLVTKDWAHAGPYNEKIAQRVAAELSAETCEAGVTLRGVPFNFGHAPLPPQDIAFRLSAHLRRQGIDQCTLSFIAVREPSSYYSLTNKFLAQSIAACELPLCNAAYLKLTEPAEFRIGPPQPHELLVSAVMSHR